MSGDDPIVRIVAGGEPDAIERAAIVRAVTEALRTDAAGPSTGSAWARAGRLEGSGSLTVRSRSDLRPA